MNLFYLPLCWLIFPLHQKHIWDTWKRDRVRSIQKIKPNNCKTDLGFKLDYCSLLVPLFLRRQREGGGKNHSNDSVCSSHF